MDIYKVRYAIDSLDPSPATAFFAEWSEVGEWLARKTVVRWVAFESDSDADLWHETEPVLYNVESVKPQGAAYFKKVSQLHQWEENEIDESEYKALIAAGYDADSDVQIRQYDGAQIFIVESDDVVCGLCGEEMTDAEIAKAACHLRCLAQHDDETESV